MMIRIDTQLMTMIIINIMINNHDTDDLINHDNLIKHDDLIKDVNLIKAGDDEDGSVKEM